jgi:four helix bundle protein
MSPILSYRDLVVWQQSLELAKLCYFKTRSFPRTEAFGLTSQIRRAGASIQGNIAEGNGRESTGHYIQSLRVSQGSLKELESHVLLAQAVELMPGQDAEQILNKCERVGKLLRALIRSLQDKVEGDIRASPPTPHFPTPHSPLDREPPCTARPPPPSAA